MCSIATHDVSLLEECSELPEKFRPKLLSDVLIMFTDMRYEADIVSSAQHLQYNDSKTLEKFCIVLEKAEKYKIIHSSIDWVRN